MENKDLLKSLAQFQYEVPIIHRATAGYGYSYTDLPEIIRTITPLLKKHDLGYTQLLEGTAIKTIIFHTETGQSIESITEIPQNETLKGMNKFQVLGSAITYFRRYSLSCALGLVTDKDLDGCGTPESQEEKERKKAEEQERDTERFKASVISKLEATTTLEQLKTEWSNISKDWQPLFNEVKENQKNKLTNK